MYFFSNSEVYLKYTWFQQKPRNINVIFFPFFALYLFFLDSQQFTLLDFNSYGPGLPILSEASQITHCSPDPLNQEKFSRIFNILKYLFSSENESLFDSFHVPSFSFLRKSFSDFVLSSLSTFHSYHYHFVWPRFH